MKKLKHKTQPTGDTCTSACLAMLLGTSVDKVVSEFHSDWRNRKSTPSDYLLENGISFVLNHNPYNNTLEWGGLFLITVPSLNLDGRLHHILADLRGDLEVILDPNKGREGKRYYTGWSREPEDKLGVQLKSWVVDMQIMLENGDD